MIDQNTMTLAFALLVVAISVAWLAIAVGKSNRRKNAE